jgi:ankyrin repeat protein
LNIKNVNSETPLHIAAAYDGSDNYEIVKLMIENGADLSILDISCRTPLHVALLYQADLKIINLFAEQGVFNSATCLNECFLLACRIEDTSYFDYFIEKGANPSYKSEFDQTGLYFASHFGQIEIVKRLLNCGVDVNVTDCYGSTPLLAASELGLIDVVKLLLSHGANLNAISPVMGWTAFQVACLNKNTELADFLLESGADVSIKSAYQQEMFKSLFEMPVIFEKVMERITDFNVPILHAICEVDNYEMLVEYINNGYNFESLNHKGETPLFHAKDPEIIEELLGRSVDLNFRSSDGITPLSKTCMTGNMTLFKKLIEMETVDIHALCIKNRSALAYAVFHGELEMIKILLDKGLDANHVDSHQFTPVALILEGYCKLYMDNREVANEKALEMILVLKNAGGIFLHVGGYDRYRENVVVKAYFELVADE